MLKSYLQSFSSLKTGGFYSYSSNVLNKVPIKQISKADQQIFIISTDTIYNLTNEYYKKRNKFLHRLVDSFEDIKITIAIENFDELDFKGFIKELLKQKINLPLILQDEWEEYFYGYKSEIAALKAAIEKTDKEIDRIVYELYGLTEEEIKIVEESV